MSSIPNPAFKSFSPSDEEPASKPPPPAPERLGLAAILFLLTCLTTLVAGFMFDFGFRAATGDAQQGPFDSLFSQPLQLFRGLPFAATLLGILLAHEMGHYLTCRRYLIRATLPFAIPAPPLLPLPPPLGWLIGVAFGLKIGFLDWFLLPFNPFGTFGAVIRIKSRFHDRRQLFDVGIAGPLAGFAVVIPALIVGVAWSRPFVSPPTGGLVFGEPLLFHLAVQFLYGGDSSLMALHPIGWAAWFGMLATSLNLLPIGQLDGGHVTYALFGARRHYLISRLAFLALLVVSLFSWPALGYLVFALLLIAMGFRHPATECDALPAGRRRILVAIIGAIILILCFVPVPIQLVEESIRI